MSSALLAALRTCIQRIREDPRILWAFQWDHPDRLDINRINALAGREIFTVLDGGKRLQVNHPNPDLHPPVSWRSLTGTDADTVHELKKATNKAYGRDRVDETIAILEAWIEAYRSSTGTADTGSAAGIVRRPAGPRESLGALPANPFRDLVQFARQIYEEERQRDLSPERLLRPPGEAQAHVADRQTELQRHRESALAAGHQTGFDQPEVERRVVALYDQCVKLLRWEWDAPRLTLEQQQRRDLVRCWDRDPSSVYVIHLLNEFHPVCDRVNDLAAAYDGRTAAPAPYTFGELLADVKLGVSIRRGDVGFWDEHDLTAECAREFGTGITYGSLVSLRDRLCRKRGWPPEKIDGMAALAVIDLICDKQRVTPGQSLMALGQQAIANNQFFIATIQVSPFHTMDVHRADCLIVDGESPSLCPDADPIMPVQFLPRVEQSFRALGLLDLADKSTGSLRARMEGRLKPGRTIHWIGYRAYARGRCRCFVAPTPPAPAARPATEAVTAGQGDSPSAQVQPAITPPFQSANDLAKTLGLSGRAAAVETFLRRYREKFPDCFREAEGARRNEPRYLYRVADVLPALREHFKERE